MTPALQYEILQEILLRSKDEGANLDPILDEMDQVWEKMTPEEQKVADERAAKGSQKALGESLTFHRFENKMPEHGQAILVFEVLEPYGGEEEYVLRTEPEWCLVEHKEDGSVDLIAEEWIASPSPLSLWCSREALEEFMTPRKR